MNTPNGPLVTSGVARVYHYFPLHYLPFILRAGRIYSKARLASLGFASTHFRSTSSRQDVARGFNSYVHMTVTAHPPILNAKLGRGFPHVEISVPAIEVEKTTYDLCRFNVAKSRFLRGGRSEPLESECNGRYYNNLKLPIARTAEEKIALLRCNLGRRMVEVLVLSEIKITKAATLTIFSTQDMVVAQENQKRYQTDFQIQLEQTLSYPHNPQYRRAVMTFIKKANEDTSWLGDGLEFDRV